MLTRRCAELPIYTVVPWPCCTHRQQRDLADVELARLSAEVEASAAVAADAQGLLASAEATSRKQVEAAQAAQIKVRGQEHRARQEGREARVGA